MCVSLSGCANRLFYYPTRIAYSAPGDLRPPAHEVWFTSADGTRLHGWFCPAEGPAKGTVLHCHGNAENLTSHVSFVKWLPARGFNVLVWDYRGYGKSEGREDRQGLLDDTLAAFAAVRTMPGVDQQRLLVIGQSLGGANVLAALARGPQPGVRAAVIDSTFAGYRAIAREKIRAIPILGWFRVPLAALLVSDRHSALPLVAGLAPLPLVFLHGDADPVIPWTHSKQLAAAAGANARLWVLPGGVHTEGLLHSDVQDRVVAFFEEALRAAPSP